MENPQDSNAEDGLLSVPEAAKLLNRSITSVRSAILRQTLPVARVTLGHPRLRPEDVEAFRLRTQPNGEKLRGRPKSSGAQDPE